MFIGDVLPEDLYQEILQFALLCKSGEPQQRLQDNSKFVNRRYSLVNCHQPAGGSSGSCSATRKSKPLAYDQFYLEPVEQLAPLLRIHDEFEFVYTAAGRFQNIHVDIPPKYLSFVFYLPDRTLSALEEDQNATVLYDEQLLPNYQAKYRRNSVCIFAPHFHSYHGFSTTTDRNALVMCYINEESLTSWHPLVPTDVAPFDVIKETTARKLRAHPLIEYGRDEANIEAAREKCRINGPNGRVMRDA